MKLKHSSILCLIFMFTVLPVFAQKTKPMPKPAPKTKDAPPAAPKSPDAAPETKAKAEVFYQQGQAHWKNLDITDAIASFSKALEIYPNYADALRERGSVYYMISRYDEALTDLNAFLKIEPNNARMRYFRGLTLTEIAAKLLDTEISRKKANAVAQDALADFNKAIELSPKETLYFNGRGKLFFNFEFYNEAISDFENSLKLDPNNYFANIHLGYAKFITGKGEGIPEINKGIAAFPAGPESFYFRAEIHRINGNLKEALNDYNTAISKNPDNAKYYNARGMLNFRLQDGYGAVNDFTKAIRLKNDFGTAYYNRAFTYKKFPYSVSDDDENPILKIRLQRDKMLEDFSAAIRYKPGLSDAYVERGLIYSTDPRIGSGKLEQKWIDQLNLALADYEQAIKLDPQSAEAYNGRASCNDRLGKKDLALADYTKAVELDPKLVTAYMGRMAIYCEMGKKELSIADEKKIKALGYAALNVCSF